MPADLAHGGATLAPPTRRRLHEELVATCGASVVPFAEQVTRQLSHPLAGAAAPADAAERERREAPVAARVAGIVRAACDDDGRGDGGGGGIARAASLLAADVPLLSAFFQNLDLLPAGSRAGDRLALLVMEAMGHLAGG